MTMARPSGRGAFLHSSVPLKYTGSVAASAGEASTAENGLGKCFIFCPGGFVLDVAERWPPLRDAVLRCISCQYDTTYVRAQLLRCSM